MNDSFLWSPCLWFEEHELSIKSLLWQYQIDIIIWKITFNATLSFHIPAPSNTFVFFSIFFLLFFQIAEQIFIANGKNWMLWSRIKRRKMEINPSSLEWPCEKFRNDNVASVLSANVSVISITNYLLKTIRFLYKRLYFVQNTIFFVNFRRPVHWFSI